MTDRIRRAAASAFALVDAVGDPWLYRAAADSTDEPSVPLAESRLEQPDGAELLIYSRERPDEYIVCDEFEAPRP